MLGKLRRIGQVTITQEISVLRILDYLRPEIFLGLALFALFAWLTLELWPRGKRRLALVGAFVCFALFASLEISGASYCVATGDYGFSFSLIVFGLSHIRELAPVLASESQPLFFYMAAFFFGFGALMACLGPQELPELWYGRRRGFLALGIVSLVVSLWPSFHAKSVQYSQSVTRNVLVSAIFPGGESMLQKIDLGNFERKFPTDAKAVAKDPEAPKKNLILVMLESVRARSTTPYNPKLDTFPRMHELFRDATRYQNTFTVVPHTTKAITGILCGVEPYLSLFLSETDPFYGVPAQCIPQLLKEHGYQSGFFQAARKTFEAREGLVKNMGFEHFIHRDDLDEKRYPFINYFGPEDDALLPHTKEWIQGLDPKQPVFLSILTLITHHKYHTPKDFARKPYVEDPKGEEETHLNDYLNGVLYTDRFLDRLFTQLKELGRYQNSLIVVIGDHGEGFGEHGRNQHDTVIWNEGIRVPFWIFDPQNPKGEVHEAPVSSLDLLPTVLDRLGFDLEGTPYPGFRAQERPADAPIFTHCFRNHSCASVIESGKKFIFHYGERPDELYDLTQDPQETKDLIEAHPKLAETLRNKVLRWKAENNVSYNLFHTEIAQVKKAALKAK